MTTAQAQPATRLTWPENRAAAFARDWAGARAVDAAYRPDGGARSYASAAERVAFLFRRYATLTAPLA